MQKIFISLILFTMPFSVYAQLDVVIINDTSAGAKVQIKNDTNGSNSFTGITSGSGAGLFGSNTALTGFMIGVIGTSASTSNGSGASAGATGVLGQITSTSAGGYSAGVRGINSGTGATGIGVVGYHAGAGWGVYGETSGGFGVYGLATKSDEFSVGVRGETFSANGIAVEAKYTGTGIGTALEIDNGAIRVAGTNKAAFTHIATVANKFSANGTDIDNPMCNNDPDCLLFVTQKLDSSNTIYNNSPIGVHYSTIRNKWEIVNENNVAIPTNARFNVLIIKQ